MNTTIQVMVNFNIETLSVDFYECFVFMFYDYVVLLLLFFFKINDQQKIIGVILLGN